MLTHPRNKVLLVDADSTIPNIVLMKLATFYKSKDFVVNLVRLGVSYYPPKRKLKSISAFGYAKVFVSIIYEGNKNFVNITDNENVEYGGTGCSVTKKLPPEVEVSECDYTIYPNNNTSYGFITRGCPYNCSFCCVPEKEGKIHQVSDIGNIVHHNKVKFLDNNILAWKGHKEILQELVDKEIRCQFNQGLDIRLVNDENAKLLSQLNYMGEYIFAFDNISQEKLITKKTELFRKYVTGEWKLKFFIYCHPDMNIADDVYHRILWCKRHKVLPFFMRDISCWDSEYNELYIDLAAYCNQPPIFKKMTFSEFLVERHPKNPDRIKKGNALTGSLCLAKMVFDKIL